MNFCTSLTFTSFFLFRSLPLSRPFRCETVHFRFSNIISLFFFSLVFRITHKSNLIDGCQCTHQPCFRSTNESMVSQDPIVYFMLPRFMHPHSYLMKDSTPNTHSHIHTTQLAQLSGNKIKGSIK